MDDLELLFAQPISNLEDYELEEMVTVCNEDVEKPLINITNEHKSVIIYSCYLKGMTVSQCLEYMKHEPEVLRSKQSMVYKRYREFKNGTCQLTRKVGSGRKKVLTPENIEKLRSILEQDPAITHQRIKLEWNHSFPIIRKGLKLIFESHPELLHRRIRLQEQKRIQAQCPNITLPFMYQLQNEMPDVITNSPGEPDPSFFISNDGNHLPDEGTYHVISIQDDQVYYYPAEEVIIPFETQ